MLVQEKVVSESEAKEMIEAAASAEKYFVQHLVSTGSAKALDLALWLSKRMSYPYLDLNSVDVLGCVPEKLDLKMIQTTRCLPLAKKGKTLYVAVSDPTNDTPVSDLKFHLQASAFYLLVVEDDKLDKAISQLVKNRDVSMTDVMSSDDGIDMGNLLDDMAADGDDEPPSQEDSANGDVDDAPVVKFLQKVLIDAINQGASDLHFEPYEKFYRIRFRQDGILAEYNRIPLAIKDKLTSRIKVISKLDISEKRIPQDGRMRLVLNKNRVIDFRVSTLPTLFGEKIVMRILDPSSAKLGIDALGYDPIEKERLLAAVHRPYGMVLVTGPTGSGKTVSLYTCLNILNDDGINISTAEDPAEINLPGINQVNVTEKNTFPLALKAFLRQDPDVIMVGEIRDLETADIAMKAALTGHLVLSTLHTNDAPSTVTRLLDMGVKPFNIASAVIMVTAQRLARRLCPHCKKAVRLEEKILLDAGYSEEDLKTYGKSDGWQTYEPVGCEQCKKGYKGRVGIYQVMPINDEIREIVLRHGTSMEIAAASDRAGVLNLRQSGLMKVRQGITSLEEVLGCTNE